MLITLRVLVERDENAQTYEEDDELDGIDLELEGEENGEAEQEGAEYTKMYVNPLSISVVQGYGDDHSIISIVGQAGPIVVKADKHDLATKINQNL